MDQVINKDGINVNVGIDTTSLVILIAGVFLGVVLGGVLVKLLTKNL